MATKLMRSFAWHAGKEAREKEMQRVVPAAWQHSESAWLAGYDDRPLAEAGMIQPAPTLAGKGS